MYIHAYLYIYMNPCWPNCLQVRGIVRRPRPHYISFTRPKAVGEGRSMSCPVLGPRSGWGHVFHGGKPRGPKTSPCLLPPQTGRGATKICPILFFHFPKKDSGPPRNACQKLEKNTFCPPRWKWPRLTTSWHLKEGFTLNVVHHADELSVVYEKKERGKKDYPTTYVPERTFHNVRSGRPPVPTERTKAMTLPTCW